MQSIRTTLKNTKMKRIPFLVTGLLVLQVSLSAQQVYILRDSTETPELDLAEIEIKASKNRHTLREMPASVTLVSSSEITGNQVKTLSDVSSIAPGFFMPDYGSKLTSPVYIRGIGSRINAPSVGLYVDHVPYVEKAAFAFDFYDVERIEVLKGPQGTLYGRNTMGGIINVVTTSPFDYQGTSMQLSAGNYGDYRVSAGHYGKSGDSFGYSVAANLLHRDGFFTNQFSGDRVDAMNSAGGRTRLEWKITPELSVENITSYEFSDQGGYPYSLYNDSLSQAESINYNHESTYRRSMLSSALVVDYRKPSYEIRSTTSFQHLDDLQEIDQDFTPDSLYFVAQDQVQWMASQEVIIRSARSGKPYQWLFGGYAFTQWFDKGVDVDVFASDMKLFKRYDHTISGAALFHQSTLRDVIVDGLSLTAGIRLDGEKDILDYHYDMESGGALVPMEDTVYPAREFLEVLPKIALNYKQGKNSYYASIAKGYKTGGFNSTIERDQDLYYHPEYSWNYEAGLKASLFGNRVYADLSVFYIDWKNQQIYQPVPSGRGSMLKNAGHSASRGFETTVKTLSFHGISPQVSYGFTDARFVRHVVDSVTDYSGNRIPYIPRHTLSLQVKKTIRPEILLDRITLNLLYRGVGSIYWNEENSHRQDFYNLLDMRVALVRKGISLELWARNLLGTDYEAFYFEALGNAYVQTGKPVRFGINLAFDF